MTDGGSIGGSVMLLAHGRAVNSPEREVVVS
jgi:hypothetical protein